MSIYDKYSFEIDSIQHEIDELVKGNYSHALAERLNRKFTEFTKNLKNNSYSTADVITRILGEKD